MEGGVASFPHEVVLIADLHEGTLTMAAQQRLVDRSEAPARSAAG